MSSLAAEELDPLASASLLRRFPHLKVAMDEELMRKHLQSALFDGPGFDIRAWARPKADVKGDVCWLQYPLEVSTAPDLTIEVLVLAAMFADPAEAARFEKASLASQLASLPPPAVPMPPMTGVIEPLGMVVSLFPVNGALPTLVEATNPKRIDELLRSVPVLGADPAVAGVELVRFRRTRGCVLRYRLQTSSGPAVVYGKVGSPAAAAAAEVVRDGLDALLGQRSSFAGGPIHIPRLLAHSVELDLKVMANVPGARPDLRVEAELTRAVDGAALVAAWLHRSDLSIGTVRGLEVEIARAREPVEQISQDAPGLAGWLNTIIDSLDAISRQIPAQSVCLAHGDLTPSQIVLAGPRIGVLDFDGLCQAEPAFDLGRFLAYLRVALARSGNVAGDALALRFLERYHAAGGPPTPPVRVQVYEIASLVRLAAHSWQQLKPDRLRLACGVIDRQIEALQLPLMRGSQS
jgi:hypothetical protein